MSQSRDGRCTQRHTRIAAAIVAAVMAVTFAITARAADRPWTLIRGEHAAIIGQQPANTLRAIALQIEQFRAVIGGLIPNAQRPLAVPTVVYVFGTAKEMRPFVPIFNGKPVSLGGYFHHDGEVNYIALDLEALAESSQVVFHEYTHLLLRNATPSIPVWLDEGLAEYYSTYALAANGRRAEIGRAVPRHLALLRERVIPIAQLIAVDQSSALYNEGERRSIFYAESWALTHYLMIELPDGPRSINAYVAAVAGGRHPGEAFTAAFGMSPDAFDTVLRRYVMQPVFRSLAYSFAERVPAEAFANQQTVSAPEREAWLGDLQRRVGRVGEAAPRIEAAVKAAPAAAMTHFALALLRLSQDRRDEAWPSFNRAAALAPDDFLVQFTFGARILRDRSTGVSGDAGELARARALLAHASAINPTSSEAFAWLAYAEMVSDHRLSAARAAIARAIALAPGRLDYRLRSADISVLEDRLDEADALLTQLAGVTTDPLIAHGAKARLERIAAYQARVAESKVRAAAPDDRDQPRETEDRAFTLRALRRNEQRAYGELTELECAKGRVRFHLRVGSRDIVSTAASVAAVELTGSGADKDVTLACGRREPPDAVYLTWRLTTPRSENGTTVVGDAVAVEFVPRGYTPRD